MTTQQYFAGTGRRKTAVARVRLYPGSTEVVVNGRTLKDALPRIVLQEVAMRPLVVLGQAGKFGVQAKCEGGGVTGWAGKPRTSRGRCRRSDGATSLSLSGMTAPP